MKLKYNPVHIKIGKQQPNWKKRNETKCKAKEANSVHLLDGHRDQCKKK